VVTGHTHQPRQEWRDAVLFLNPGSAGPRRFRLPVTVAIVQGGPTRLAVEFLDLLGGGRYDPEPRQGG
jgi:predicted phosphodiesterase